MVKKITLFFFIILGSLLSSCVFYTLKYSDQFMGFKLPISKNLNSELQIRTDGFYSLKVIYKNNTYHTKNEYYYWNYLFFKDGTIQILSNQEEPDKCRTYLYNVVRNLNSEANKFFYEGPGLWGGYRINNNIITIRTIHSPVGMSQYVSQDFLRVIDSNIIELIKSYSLNNTNENRLTGFEFSQAQFIQCDTLPSSDSWLKKEKWFWEDKNAYKEYIKSLKNK